MVYNVKLAESLRTAQYTQGFWQAADQFNALGNMNKMNTC
jgi:hypothetical protein